MTKSEQLLSAFSEDYFFKELVLDDLWFTPPGGTKIELADLLINMGDIVVAIQLKERNEADQTGDPKEEKKWFDDRCKSAKKQVKVTLQYISTGVLPAFVNKRGQSVSLQSDATVIPLVVFENSQLSDYPPLLRKHSESGMNINCMSLADYREMCRILVTPMEIVDYLEYRKEIYEKHGDIDILILEGSENRLVLTKPRKNETLVHQFLVEKYEMKEIADQRLCIQFCRNFLRLLPERTVNCSAADGTYNVLTFLAHMQRFEVAELEEGFSNGQKGSSAMPHKKNPIAGENLSGLARILRSNTISAMENIALWHERDISHSSVERVIFPDSTILIDYMLHRCYSR